MKILVAMAAVGCVSCATANKPISALDDLLARHAAARSGEAAIEAIDNIRTRVEIVEPSFTVIGDYRAREANMRIDIYAENARVFSEGIDADGSWQQNGDGEPVTGTSAAGGAALLHGIEFNLFGLHQLAARGHSLSLLNDETIDGLAYKVVKIVLSDGFETYIYLNPVTAMVERRRDVRALHPDADPTTKLIENQYFDFTEFCGVLFPASSRQIDVMTGEELQRTKILSQDCNLADDALEISRDDIVD